jgi:nucleotide-binding universal stress UspA family protein
MTSTTVVCEPLMVAPARVGEQGWPLRKAPISLSARTVLVATDGSPEAAAATHLARALAKHGHAQVHAFSVAEARPAAAIAREAAREHAALVVLGLRPYGKLERALHVETTVEVMRAASCPVLGVPAGMEELPSRVLVAVDFGSASLEAARFARALVAPGGRLVLAYVAPASFYGPTDGETLIQAFGVKACFEHLRNELSTGRVAIEHLVLHHERPATVGDALLAYALESGVQLIATGSAHHNIVDRWMLGSVSTDLAHDALCALLVMPPTDP